MALKQTVSLPKTQLENPSHGSNAGRRVSAQCFQEGKQQCELTLVVLRLLGIFGKGRLSDA